MSDTTLTFIQLALNGDVLPEEIDDFVDAWHEGIDKRELDQFLGMTPEEYSLWIANPDFLEIILAARYKHQSLSRAVNDNVQPTTRLAARSDQSWKVALLKRWIEQQRGFKTPD